MNKTNLIIIAMASVVVIGAFCAQGTGYFPWFEQPMPPTGTEIDNPTCNLWEGTLSSNMPSLNNINYEFFQVDASSLDIMGSYKSDLISQGYHVITHEDFNQIDNPLEGQTTIGEYGVYYAGYIKGVTVVVILSAEVVNGTCVIYLVGPGWEFIQLANEISNYM